MPLRRSIATLLLLAAPLQAQAPQERIVERYKQMLDANPAEGTALDRLWKLYLDQGKSGELIAEYRASGRFADQLVLGFLLRKAGQLEEAQIAFERAARLDESSAQPLLALARMRAEAGQAREAAAWFEKAVARIPKSDPRMPEVLMQLGAQWLALGDLTKAAEAWELTVAANPSDLELRRRLADTYAQNHLPDRAIAHLEYMVQHAPPAERAVALQQQARIHQGAGNQDAAIATLEKALALTTPGNWLRTELQSQLIRLHQRYHRTPELEERWKKYAQENPRDLAGYLQLVDLYERLGDLEQERVWLEKLTQLLPKNADYRVRLARLLVQMDQLDAAALAYDGLLKEQPGSPELVFERARIDVQRNATAAARDRIARLLTLRKNDEALRAKALEFYEQNRLTDLVEQHFIAEAAAGGEDPVLALASFYFTQRREADANRTLARLAKSGGTPAEQAARRFKVAQLLKTQNQVPQAISELETAAQLQPEVRDFHLQLGELYSARAQHTAAQAAFQRAHALSKTPGEEFEADQKLFESFRSEQPDSPVSARIRPGAVFPLPGTPQPTISTPALDQYLAAMEGAQRQQPSEAGWLRVARWRLWMRDLPAAHGAVNQALMVNGQSIPAHEMLVKLASNDGPSPAAVVHLLKLMELDPPNRANYQRRAGQTELQAGRIGAALELFQQLVRESPGNLDALTDLALTQQRADRWPDALETWRQVYALSPVSKKREAFTPLLRVLERLQMHTQAAELQLRAIETEADERQQFLLLNDLLAHCARHQLLDWLRTEFEKRRRLRADDYFTEMALGRILKVSGNKAAAFEVLADASFAAPNQAEALPELISEAEELRKLDAAVKLQAQLLRIVPQTRPEGFEKLAQLQEKNFDFEAAAKTWDRLVTKFPRDTAVLSHAVDFQLRGGTPERALELLRSLRTLEPNNLKALMTLAELSQESGAFAEAESVLEQLLKNSTPEAPGDPLRYPALKPEDASRLQTAYLNSVRQRKGVSSEAMRALRTFWVEETAEPKAGGDREVRLNAIRALAQIQREKAEPARQAWIARWRIAGPPSEALWALYYSGAGAALLDRLEGLMKAAPTDAKAPHAYIWLALQSGEFQRLSAWLQDRRRTPSERDAAQIALGQFVGLNEGTVDPGFLESLFPQGFDQRVWQTATTVLAARNHFREAAQLGRRVFDKASTQRALFGRELARWHLYLGEVDAARAVLRASIAGQTDAFDAEFCAALREYFLLLPEKERAPFVVAYLSAIDEVRQPLHRAICGTILHALSGDEAAARQQLDALLALRPLSSSSADEAASPGARRWRYLLAAGNQLQLWHFDKLAIHLWDRALADEALLQLEGEPARETAREVRQRLFALRTARAMPLDMQKWIDEFERGSTRDGLIPLGEALETLGASGRAIEVYRQLWEREPANPQALRNLLNACRAANDHESAEAALWQAISNGAVRPNDLTQRDLLPTLVDLLERKGEFAQARRVLGEGVENSPTDTRLLLRLGQLHERAGDRPRAESVYRRLLTIEPGNLVARTALAGLLEAEGRLDAALALLARGGSADADARLAHLQLKAGQIDEALSTLERIATPQHVTPTLALASALAERGERRLARTVVQSALARIPDPGLGFPLYCKAVELLTPDDGPAAAQRELRRIRQLASGQPNLLGSYLDFARPQATRLGLEKEFIAELRTLWADGKGPIAAGTVLFASQIATPPQAEETLRQVLARQDAGEVWLQRLTGVLDSAKLPELALRVRERLAQINPVNPQLTMDWVAALRQLGRPAEARAALERLALRAALDEEITPKVAEAFAALGDGERARQLFTRTLRDDPFARNAAAYLGFVRLQLAEQDFAGARRTLRTAFSNPANREFGAIIDYLTAAGRLSEVDVELTALELSPPRQTAVRRELLLRLAKERQLTPALAIVENHPQTLTSATPGVLRELAQAVGQFEAVAALLEKLLLQAPDHPELSLELARLFGAWAEADLTAARPEAALGHLRRGHQLRPDSFELARPLAVLQSQSGAAKNAAETLETYLAAATNQPEIAKARELLTRLKSGAKL